MYVETSSFNLTKLFITESNDSKKLYELINNWVFPRVTKTGEDSYAIDLDKVVVIDINRDFKIPSYLKNCNVINPFNEVRFSKRVRLGKISLEALKDIISEYDSNDTLFIIPDYLQVIHVYDRGDKRFQSQLHQLRYNKGGFILGYNKETYIQMTDKNINVSYRRNESEKAKVFHRLLRNPNIEFISNDNENRAFVEYELTSISKLNPIQKDFESSVKQTLRNIIIYYLAKAKLYKKFKFSLHTSQSIITEQHILDHCAYLMFKEHGVPKSVLEQAREVGWSYEPKFPDILDKSFSVSHHPMDEFYAFREWVKNFENEFNSFKSHGICDNPKLTLYFKLLNILFIDLDMEVRDIIPLVSEMTSPDLVNYINSIEWKKVIRIKK